MSVSVGLVRPVRLDGPSWGNGDLIMRARFR